MNTMAKLCGVSIFGLAGALLASDAVAQTIAVTPANPTVAVGDTQQFTATGNLTPTLVSASGSHSCALLPNGTIRCWGYNEYGQLGNGSTVDFPTPVEVLGTTDAIAISAGHHHTCALLADGSVRCWGRNEFGELGDGTICSDPPCATPVPVAVRGITTAIAVTAGAYHSCALLPNGEVQCWGSNEFGQLGNGATTDSSTPVTVIGLAAPARVTAGAYHTCALMPDATVQCWGRNDAGQLGNGETPDSSTPVAVAGLTDAVSVTAGGFHNCTLLTDATLRCWGLNSFGQLGDGSSLTHVASRDLLSPGDLWISTLPPGSHSRTPVEVAGISTATAVAAGGFHACASLADGSTKCWGQNDFGQLGDGTTTSSSTPGDVSGLAPGAAVSTAAWHTCALLPDASVEGWGYNEFGQLGHGAAGDSSTPVGVIGTGPVTWTSSDTAVASIGADSGLATALSPGSTTITATANGASGTTILTVGVRLSVATDGPGTGMVTSSPAGIDCGTDCAEIYPGGTVVAITATPDAGSTFTGWTGRPCYGVGTCWINLTANITVTATFHPTGDTVTLSVTKDGTGTGLVRSDPAGIKCGTQCTAPFVIDTVVTLTAAADDGSAFAGWSGAGCSGSGTCTLTLTTDTTVMARFDAADDPPIVPGAQEVVWTSAVNVTVTGNSIEKTGGCDTCDDAGAVSAQQITSGDGYVEFTIPLTTRQAFAGLSTGNVDTSRSDIDFALKVVGGGTVEVRENNIWRATTTFAANDVFRVAVVGGQVQYSKNGVVFYTSMKPPVYPLLLDSSLQDLNVRIENAVIFGAS